MSVILGIDIGGSTTKIVGRRRDGSTIAMLIVVRGVVLSNVANRVFKPSDDL